jgi:hypothetical protein
MCKLTVIHSDIDLSRDARTRRGKSARRRRKRPQVTVITLRYLLSDLRRMVPIIVISNPDLHTLDVLDGTYNYMFYGSAHRKVKIHNAAKNEFEDATDTWWERHKHGHSAVAG